MGKENPRFIDHTGESHSNNEGCQFIIIECYNAQNCTIQFEDGTILKNLQYSNILRGGTKNPYHKSVFNMGYLGIGSHICSIKGKATKSYQTWHGIMERAYSKKLLEKHPSYLHCSVLEDWHNFQIFADWFEKNYNLGINKKWDLDKDILIKGNKVYSPDTCCFVPNEINKLFTRRQNDRGLLPIGVHKQGNKYITQLSRKNRPRKIGSFNTVEEAFQAYKIAKEEYIKEVADLWRGQITESCYEAMYNYEVEITD